MAGVKGLAKTQKFQQAILLLLQQNPQSFNDR
jgi:hypothetical protein